MMLERQVRSLVRRVPFDSRPAQRRPYAALMSPLPALPRLLDELEAEYGPLRPPHPTDAVGLLLWENVAYLVDDARRGAAFDALAATVGIQPEDILAAAYADLRALVVGMRPEDRVARLRRVAE